MFLDVSLTEPVNPAPPTGAAADWTIPQSWERFSPEEHNTWDRLFARQEALLQGKAVSAFHDGLDVLRLDRPGIPQLDAVNERLFARTGWTVVSVPGLVPDDVFFRHLSERRFPAGNFIRPANQLDYLEEPDVFHDVFGHVPLLAQPAIADFAQALGEQGLSAIGCGALARLARIYWYTIEFGLALEDGELRIFGAGLLSSFGETTYSLQSPEPRRRPLDVERVLRTPYRSDAFQLCYFVAASLDQLPSEIGRIDLPRLYEKLADLPDLEL